jgi:hypothetical protein
VVNTILEVKCLIRFFVQGLTRHRLSLTGSEFAEAPQIVITQVVPCMNQDLMMAYVNAVRAIARRRRQLRGGGHVEPVPQRYLTRCKPCSDDVGETNECVAFHGTSKRKCDLIVQQGFQPGEGGMFGAGVYSTPLPSKAISYSLEEGDGHCHVLVCLLALMNPYLAYDTRTFATASDANIPSYADSVIGMTQGDRGVVDHIEYMLSRDGKDRLLPMYRVVFKHTSTCRCNTCIRRR